MQVRKLLFPFSLLYGLITSVRNKLFDWTILQSKSYDLPLISIGNITVGGTGKTPLTEYLIRLLHPEHTVCLLSRGYKRKTSGALLATKDSTVLEIGDEPYQIKTKFPGIEVVVAEKRVEGMELIQQMTEANVVLMDDAYQHRSVSPGLSILVIDFNRPMWKDLPFPAGELRETKGGQKRADIILVNKCPGNMSPEEREKWIKKLNILSHQRLFFSSISYGPVIDKEGRFINVENNTLLAVAGVANPQPFYDYLNDHYKVGQTITFPDHHAFNNLDLIRIKKALEPLGDDGLIVTTEKDFIRLFGLDNEIDKRLVYIPIQLNVLFDEEKLLELIIRNYVRDYQKNS